MKLSLIFVFIVALSGSSFALSGEKNRDINYLLGESDLVFQGRVDEVIYKNSTSLYNEPSLPHTFVVYNISRIISGSYNRGQITLRFKGGVMKDNPDVVMMSSHFPLFNVDDEDILFVKNNGSYSCPLVECSNGRLRVFDGIIHDNEGMELTLSNSDVLHGNGVINNSKIFTERTIGNNVIKLRSGNASQKKSRRSFKSKGKAMSDNDLFMKLRKDIGNYKRKKRLVKKPLSVSHEDKFHVESFSVNINMEEGK